MPIFTGRRDFLKSVVSASGLALASRNLRAEQNAPRSVNSQITLGCIGLGIHGIGWNLEAFLKIPEARVLGVCDVFKSRQEEARAMVNTAYGNSDCAMYTDFREILRRDDIDAVVISTPDHWHVLMAVMAARAGKDVFCEKPTLNVSQGKVLIEAIAKAGIVYQGGIEDRSVDQYYRIAELARNGRLGKVQRILVTLPEGVVFPKENEAPIPEGFDYDLWLGPAPYTPYTPTKTGAQEWRNVWDYSGGKLTDWGAHLIDTAQVAIFEEHGGPLEIDGKGEFPKDAMSTTATKYEIHYRYKNDVEMIVKSGGAGIRIEGSEGWIECPDWRAPLAASKPEILEAKITTEENKLWPKPPTEHVDFIQAVKNRTKPIYTPQDIHHLSTTMHLGNISMRLGRKLIWDPASGQIANDEEATALLTCPMRAPWTFDAPA
ncbi:MAG: Gfo/Idh/MocA family oxidoreductase [Candidatus Hydrogenedentes bacterium]|nr:Gfo/Idh/MocA family oxidoreductase [Candidatus Hydrogenedentota bacterium]